MGDPFAYSIWAAGRIAVNGCNWAKVQRHHQAEMNRPRGCHDEIAPVRAAQGHPEGRAPSGQLPPVSGSQRR